MIGEFSQIVGVPIATLRKWDKSGKLVAHRTEGGECFGQRYYTDAQVDFVFENIAIAKCPHCGKSILRY